MLQTALPTITGATTIQGLGSGQLTVNGNGNQVFFADTNEAITLSGMTVQNGRATGGAGGAGDGGGGGGLGAGGGLFIASGAVTGSDLVFTGNAAQGGAGGAFIDEVPAGNGGDGPGARRTPPTTFGRGGDGGPGKGSTNGADGGGNGGVNGGGGGGAGFGGAVYVSPTGQFVYGPGTISGNTATGGAAGLPGGTAGASAGAGVFLTNSQLQINVAGGNVTVADSIGGGGGVSISGSGTAVLSGVNTFTNGTFVNGGATLEVSSDDNLGAPFGTLTVALDNGTLRTVGPSFTTTKQIGIFNNGTIDVPGSNTAVFNGNINAAFGPGDLTKTGTGTAVFNGTNDHIGTTVQAGTLEVNGVETAVTVGESGRLQGTGRVGNLANNGTVGAGSGVNGIGTLTGGGTFTQTAAATFDVDVSPSVGDSLVVSGTASLDGRVLVRPQAGTYRSRTAYTILQAGGGLNNTQFASVAVTDPTRFRATLSYDPDEVFLTLDLLGIFATFAANGNQGAVGGALDSLITNGTVPASLQPLVDALAALPAGQVPGGLQQLTGVDIAGANDAAINAGSLIQQQLINQLGSNRRRQQARHRAQANPPAAAAKLLPAPSLTSAFPTLHTTGTPAGDDEIWALAFGQTGDIDASASGAPGVDYNGGGFVLGRGWTAGEHATWGLHAAYAETNVHTRGTRNRNDVESFQVGVDGSWACGRAHVDGTIDFARSGFESRRFLAIGPVVNTLAGDYDGKQIAGFFLAGYDCPQKSFLLEPQASLSLRHFQQDGFSETGGAGALAFAGQDIDSVQSGLGVRATKQVVCVYDQVPLVQGGPDVVLALAGAALLAGLVALAWRARARAPAAAFWAGFALVTYLPVSNLLVPTGSIMAERFLYAPLAGLAMLCALGLEQAAGRAPRAVVAVAAALVLACGLRTAARTADWASNRALWTADVRSAPRSFRAHQLLGAALVEEGGLAALPEAIAETEEAVRIVDALPDAVNSAQPYLQLGRYCGMQAERVADGRPLFERARRALEKAARIEPRAAEVYALLGAAYLRLGRPADAVAALELHGALAPGADAWLRLAEAQLAAGRKDAAIASLDEVLKREPLNDRARRARSMLKAPAPRE